MLVEKAGEELSKRKTEKGGKDCWTTLQFFIFIIILNKIKKSWF